MAVSSSNWGRSHGPARICTVATEFCDTNVLAYAFDAAAGAKHEIARGLLTRLWNEGMATVSVQVLQELYVTLANPAKVALAPKQARDVVAQLTAWQVFSPGPEHILAAIDGVALWQVSFWDSLILVAAQASGATILWSEDLGHDRSYDGVVVRNPFR